MPLNTTVLDDTPLTEEHRKFLGVYENPAGETFDPRQLAQLRDMEVTPYGTARTRNARFDHSDVFTEYESPYEATWWNHCMHFYKVGSTEKLCVHARNHLHTWDPTNGWALIGIGRNNPEGMCRYCQVVDTLMFCDGKETFSWNVSTNAKVVATGAEKATYILPYRGRLIATRFRGSGAVEDAIMVSDALAPTTFTLPTNQIRVGEGEGDPIEAVVHWRDFFLVVLKRNSVWIIEANPAVAVANWPIRRVPSDIGCRAPRSAIQVANDVMWLGPFGVYSLSQVLGQDANEVAKPMSDGIYPWIDRINWDAAEATTAIFYNNRVLMTVPIDESEFPNATLVYSTRYEQWQGVWGESLYTVTGTILLGNGETHDTEELSAWNAISQVRTFFNGKAELAVLDSNLGADAGFIELFQWSDYDARDYIDGGNDGLPNRYYYPLLLTRPFYLQAVDYNKTGWELEVDFVNTECEVKISAVLDGDTSNPVHLWTGIPSYAVRLAVQLNFQLGGGDRIYRVEQIDLMHLGSWRSLQIQIEKSHPTNTADADRRLFGNMEVLAVRVKAFIDQV